MKTAKIKDTPGYIRDISNKAVLSVNNTALQNYRLKRQRNNEINQSLNDINKLKSDVADIKKLLTQLLNNKG